MGAKTDQFCKGDPIDKHILYQVTPGMEADSCPLFQSIAWKLMGPDNLNLGDLAACVEVHGDTMNSCSTTINAMFDIVLQKGQVKDDKTRRQLKEFKEKHPTRQGQWTKTLTKILYKENQPLFRDALGQVVDWERFNKFLLASYTVGNFIPVPAGCNIYTWTKDYWDLRLKCIYKWYREGQKDKDLVGLVGRASWKLEQYRNWLASLKSWENFVTQTCMKPFLKEDGSPLPLWENHLEEGAPVLPQSVEQINEFLKKAAIAIEARSNAIIKNCEEPDPCPAP